MNDLKVEDLLLMLLAQPEKPRDHSSNLDLFKTLFEREVGGINLTFNLASGLALAILAVIIGEIVRSVTLDANLWANVGVAIVAFIVILIFVRRVRTTRQQIRKRYLDLIRLYYYLDAVT